MSTLAIMAILSIVGTLISTGVTAYGNAKDRQYQQQLLDDQQQYQADREDINYERSSPGNQMQRYLDAGFNPNLAAASILGGNAQTGITAESSPSAPPVNSMANVLSSMFGQNSKQLQDMFKSQAEIDNLNANTTKTDIESGMIPADYELRKMSTTAQIDLWNTTADKVVSEMKLTDEQKELVKQQNMFYGREKEAQIKVYEQQVNESIKKCQDLDSQIENRRHENAVLDSEIAVNRAIELNTYQESYNTEIRTEREKIAQDFETSVGAPLSVDAQKYVHKLLLEGKYNEVKTFYTSIFQTRLQETLGSQFASPQRKTGLPFGLFERHDFSDNQRRLFMNLLNDEYNDTYWNPTFGNR